MKKAFQDNHQLYKMKHRAGKRGIVTLHRVFAGIIATGVVALVLKFVGARATTPKTAQMLEWQKMPLFAALTLPDPVVEGVVNQYLKNWSTKGAPASGQGIWIQSGLSQIAEHQGKVPLPAASLTKIATTLAALNQWGPTHQFETVVSATGPLKDGVLQGDLVITGSGDPFFVWEEAIALGNSLNQLGIRRVTGNLVIDGNFYMNYKEDPLSSGQLLQQGLNSKSWSRETAVQHALMPAGTPKPQVAIAGTVKVATIPIPKKFALIRHRSMTLAQILREMNIYSNNVMAEMLAQSVGGAQVTAQLAAKAANVPPEEILLVNGSGLGVENRISPRAACAMLMAVESFLQPHQLSVTDLFPLSGRDQRGTMLARQIPVGTAVKTGTLRDVSALAGMMPTRDREKVWFVIINRGGDVEGFRKQQDQILASLLKHWGSSATVSVGTTHSPGILGDPTRNEKISEVQIPL